MYRRVLILSLSASVWAIKESLRWFLEYYNSMALLRAWEHRVCANEPPKGARPTKTARLYCGREDTEYVRMSLRSELGPLRRHGFTAGVRTGGVVTGMVLCTGILFKPMLWTLLWEPVPMCMGTGANVHGNQFQCAKDIVPMGIGTSSNVHGNQFQCAWEPVPMCMGTSGNVHGNQWQCAWEPEPMYMGTSGNVHGNQCQCTWESVAMCMGTSGNVDGNQCQCAWESVPMCDADRKHGSTNWLDWTNCLELLHIVYELESSLLV